VGHGLLQGALLQVPADCAGRITGLRESMSCADLALPQTASNAGRNAAFYLRERSAMDTALTTFGDRRRRDAGITTGGGKSA
jgi:hypothetical protein